MSGASAPADRPGGSPELIRGGGSSYLVNTCQDPAFKKRKSWGRKQKRTYPVLKAGTYRLKGLGYSLKFVTFTSPAGTNRKKLREKHREMVRRAERDYVCQIIPFVVSTAEGQGVIHAIWGVKSLRGVKNQFISQKWLSKEWEKISGAWNVGISAVYNIDGILKYCVSQYFCGQDRFERFSYSYKKLGITLGLAWKQFKRNLRSYSPESTFCGLNPSVITVTRNMMYEGWRELFERGSAMVGEIFFFIQGGQLNYF